MPNGELNIIVYHVEHYNPPLDAAFQALSDPTRRAVISRLSTGVAPVKELAKSHNMGLPAFLKHLHVLEASGLIVTRKSGRVRTCQIVNKRMLDVESWLAEQRALWQASADRLAAYVETQMTEDEEK